MSDEETSHVTAPSAVVSSGEQPRGRPFAPGVSGNPAGRKPGPNKATRELKAFCQGLVEDPDYRAKFAEDFKRRQVDPKLELEVWNRAAGKVREQVDLNANMTFAQLVAGIRPAPPSDDDEGGS
jgi:hypothetical protein